MMRAESSPREKRWADRGSLEPRLTRIWITALIAGAAIALAKWMGWL
jgi:hypothetical protein